MTRHILITKLLESCEGGGNYPASAVPLVALGTQNGIVDVIDVPASAVAASFSDPQQYCKRTTLA